MIALAQADYTRVLAQHQRNPQDTGSSDVQIIRLSKDITHLTQHSQTHKKDYHSRYGLLNKVRQRSKLLRYLKRLDEKRYQQLISQLSLRDKS